MYFERHLTMVKMSLFVNAINVIFDFQKLEYIKL